MIVLSARILTPMVVSACLPTNFKKINKNLISYACGIYYFNTLFFTQQITNVYSKGQLKRVFKLKILLFHNNRKKIRWITRNDNISPKEIFE